MSYRPLRAMLPLLAAIPILGGCDSADASGPGSAENVTVRFAAVARPTTDVASEVNAGALELTGSNGTLRIEALHVILDRFELKRIDDGRCAEEDHACERFRAPPALLDLPLNGTGVIAVRQPVEPDTYRRLRFEIEDLDDDEENPARAQQIRELRSAIRARFPDWPRQASMLVVGTFTPTGGTPLPFRTYFEAEIEIEMRLVPPLTITAEGGEAGFTVLLDPALMFRTGNGTVRNLAALDFGTTGRVTEFEIEIEHGFTEVEFDD